MIWIAKSMLDPGDGIVTTTTFEHDSDDLCEVAADAINGDIFKDGDRVTIDGWLFSLEATAR